MSELTREEKIEAEIKEAKAEKIKIEASIININDIEMNDRELLLIKENRLNKIQDRITMLLMHLENERNFQRNNATECKVFK